MPSGRWLAVAMLNPERGEIWAPSFIKCEQILTISKARLDARLGRLGLEDLDRVATALWTVLAL